MLAFYPEFESESPQVVEVLFLVDVSCSMKVSRIFFCPHPWGHCPIASDVLGTLVRSRWEIITCGACVLAQWHALVAYCCQRNLYLALVSRPGWIWELRYFAFENSVPSLVLLRNMRRRSSFYCLFFCCCFHRIF